MPRLIHLNAPPRVGKSTLPRRYANEHPGVLALDLDVIAGLIGGYHEDFSAALEVARGHGCELAVRHLRSGYDVVLPQLVTVHDRDPDPAFEEAACAAGATYVQVALMVDDHEHLLRVQGKRPTTEVEARSRQHWRIPSPSAVDPDGQLIDLGAVPPADLLECFTGSRDLWRALATRGSASARWCATRAAHASSPSRVVAAHLPVAGALPHRSSIAA